jgi:hypothetical protein
MLSSITADLAVPGRFWTFNREECNAVAVLVGLLTVPATWNLRPTAQLDATGSGTSLTPSSFGQGFPLW